MTNPTIFKLVFSDEWPELFNNIEEFVTIEVVKLDTNQYKYNCTFEGLDYMLELNYSENLKISSEN